MNDSFPGGKRFGLFDGRGARRTLQCRLKPGPMIQQLAAATFRGEKGVVLKLGSSLVFLETRNGLKGEGRGRPRGKKVAASP